MKTLLCLILLLIFFLNVYGQKIEGRVFDATNNEGLPGATILNINDSTGYITDENGYFTLSDVHLPAKFLVSFLGYKPHLVYINNDTDFINISLNASNQHLNEVVVSADQFNRKAIDIPVAVHAIEKEDLLRNNETFITPAINRMPGVYMESGSLNTNRIAIRGIGSRSQYGTNRVRAYFNDIPLTSGEGESTLEDIDLSSIQRVEIIKGPSSSIFGAGLGGTINLISAVPDFKETAFEAGLITGSYGLKNLKFNLSHSTGNGYINMNLNRMHSDGYRENSEYDRKSLTLSSSLHSNEKLTVSFLGSYIGLRAFIPSSVSQKTFEENPRAAATTWAEARGNEAYSKALAGFSTQYRFSDTFKNYSSVFLTFRNADEPRPFDILRESSTATGFRSRFEYKINSLTMQLGAEVFSDWYYRATYENLYESFLNSGSVAGMILTDNKELRNYFNIFSQIRWKTSEKLSLEGGINYNSTYYQLEDQFFDDINQSGTYRFEPVISPRLAGIYKIREGLNLYTSISHGFSNPSLAETLTPEGKLNTDIKAETGFNFEAGLKGRWFENTLYGEISLYRADIRNLIVYERTGPDEYIGINAGRTTHDGAEALINYYWNLGYGWSLDPFLSFTLTNYRFNEFNNQETDYSGKRISGFPDHILNLGFDLKSDRGLYLFADVRKVGEAPINDANTIYNQGYSLLNMKAGYVFKPASGWTIDLNAGINNALDEKYASMVVVNAVGFGNAPPRYYYPGLPRNFYFGFRLSYSLSF